MKCIVCRKNIPKNGDVCNECDKLMDMLYRKNPKDKEFTIKIFREENSRRNKK